MGPVLFCGSHASGDFALLTQCFLEAPGFGFPHHIHHSPALRPFTSWWGKFKPDSLPIKGCRVLLLAEPGKGRGSTALLWGQTLRLWAAGASAPVPGCCLVVLS